jgi:hypothetical protein
MRNTLRVSGQLFALLLAACSQAELTAPGPTRAAAVSNSYITVQPSQTQIVAKRGRSFGVLIVADLSNAGALDLASVQMTASWAAQGMVLDSVVAAAPGWSVVDNQTSALEAIWGTFSSEALAASSPLATLYFTAITPRSDQIAFRVDVAGTELGADITTSIRTRPVSIRITP